MNKSTLIGLVAGIGLAAAVGGIAGYAVLDDDDQPAETAAVRNCQESSLQAAEEPRDEKLIAGTAIGAIVGGAVGKDVGDSDLTTAAGAAAGAYVGRKAQEEFQENRAENAAATDC
jgi:uncharacterized protein YcfJ